MIIWGTLWGVVLGLIVSRWDGEALVWGGLLGALAGWSLRRAVDARVAFWQQLASRTVAAPLTTCAEPPATPSARQQSSMPQYSSSAATTSPPAVSGTAVSNPFEFELADPVPNAAAQAAQLDQPAEVDQATPASFAESSFAESLHPSVIPRTAESPLAAVSQKTPPTQTLSTLPQRLSRWLFGGNTVARLGAIVLFIGVAFAIRFAAEQALLPVWLRFTALAIAAFVLLGAGWSLRKRHAAYALTLQGTAIALLYLTLFTAFRLADLLSASVALLLMVVVCAFSVMLALLQNGQALAVLGVAGGFAAPVLASTGTGNHLLLFGYYAVLNAGIVAIASRKDWRALHLTGFGFTFGVATAWGVLRYRSSDYLTAQAFLVVFFLMYVAIAVLFAQRRSQLAPRDADGSGLGQGATPKRPAVVDASLVFGTPLLAFGLQVGLVQHIAYASTASALALAIFYLVLARSLFSAATLLRQSFVALAVVFATLAIPLAFDGRWVSCAWALEAAAIYWIGSQQQRWLARAFALLLQLASALIFVQQLMPRSAQPWPLANTDFVGALLLALAALVTAAFMHRLSLSRPASEAEQVGVGNHLAARAARWMQQVEQRFHSAVLLYGFAWLCVAVLIEVTRRVAARTALNPWNGQAAAELIYAIDPHRHLFLIMGLWTLLAVAFAWGGRRWANAAAQWPAYAVLPLLLLGAFIGSITRAHLFVDGGNIVWPIAVGAAVLGLRFIDRGKHAAVYLWLHASLIWLLAWLITSAVDAVLQAAQVKEGSWVNAALVLTLAAVLWLVTRWATRRSAALKDAQTPTGLSWPRDRFARAYALHGLLPVALLLLAAALWMTLIQHARIKPIWHAPLFNPVDLSFLLGVAAAWHWRQRLLAAFEKLPALLTDYSAFVVMALWLFVWINTVWLRAAHHYAGVAWQAKALFDSFLVQAGLALLWTICAVGLMLFASKRAMRWPWTAGAALMGLTVLKLFVVDLVNAAGVERVVAFMGVGALMLAVGYLAPPPSRSAISTSVEPTK